MDRAYPGIPSLWGTVPDYRTASIHAGLGYLLVLSESLCGERESPHTVRRVRPRRESLPFVLSDTVGGREAGVVLIALAFLGDPPIVLLDEPTAGMDPGARSRFWEAVRRRPRCRALDRVFQPCARGHGSQL